MRHDAVVDLGEALECLSAAMAGAQRPWCLIGSAAMALHGVDTRPADVDVLFDPADAPAVANALNLPLTRGRSDGKFRSQWFQRQERTLFSIEFMAGLEVFDGVRWTPVVVPQPTWLPVGRQRIPVAPVEALIAHCRLFARPKDEPRARLLAKLLPQGV
jgi:hypothetical protein